MAISIKISEVIVIFVVLAIGLANCRVLTNDDGATSAGRQFLVFGKAKETSVPEFVRLVVMRFIYGLASTMGVEDRLDGVLNGVFVPPNAEDDLFGFGGFGDDDGGDYGGGEGLADLFDDGGF